MTTERQYILGTASIAVFLGASVGYYFEDFAICYVANVNLTEWSQPERGYIADYVVWRGKFLGPVLEFRNLGSSPAKTPDFAAAEIGKEIGAGEIGDSTAMVNLAANDGAAS